MTTGTAFGWIGSETAFGVAVRKPSTKGGRRTGFDLVPRSPLKNAQRLGPRACDRNAEEGRGVIRVASSRLRLLSPREGLGRWREALYLVLRVALYDMSTVVEL